MEADDGPAVLPDAQPDDMRSGGEQNSCTRGPWRPFNLRVIAEWSSIRQGDTNTEPAPGLLNDSTLRQ